MPWIEVKNDSPHDKDRWVKVIECIRKNETGEIREYETDAIWDDEENKPHTWIWEEGNFACDCNRELSFLRANNEDKPDQLECGWGRFSLNLKNPADGEIIYREFAEGT